MILAAGYGTRLFPLTADRAKPALPFLNRPLVGYVAAYLARHGVQDVLVNLHHQSDSVRAALGDGSRFGVRTHFIEEPEILGTSGALDNARELLINKTFIAINGKIITDIDLSAALETHRRTQALATLVLRENPQRERFSIVNTDGELIKGFGGMPNALASSENNNVVNDDAPPPLMFTGIQILEPRIFDFIPRHCFSHSTTDVYPQAIAAGERIVAHIASGNWFELSTPARYLEISLKLKDRNLKNIVGANSFINSAADVTDSILWENARVEESAIVRRAIIGDNVKIKSGANVENKIVVCAKLVRGLALPPKALPGGFEDDNFVVSLSE